MVRYWDRGVSSDERSLIAKSSESLCHPFSLSSIKTNVQGSANDELSTCDESNISGFMVTSMRKFSFGNNLGNPRKKRLIKRGLQVKKGHRKKWVPFLEAGKEGYNIFFNVFTKIEAKYNFSNNNWTILTFCKGYSFSERNHCLCTFCF